MMKVDCVGLGFTKRGSRVFVHYPFRQADGTTGYRAGFEIDYPFRYPDGNEITRERVALIETLC